MIAKYDGKCKVTGKAIIAGKTEIEKVNGAWQVVGSDKAEDDRLAGITTTMVAVTYRKQNGEEVRMLQSRFVMSKPGAWNGVVRVENDTRPTYGQENPEGELDRQWWRDGGR